MMLRWAFFTGETLHNVTMNKKYLPLWAVAKLMF
jgi:hypothetical protein